MGGSSGRSWIFLFLGSSGVTERSSAVKHSLRNCVNSQKEEKKRERENNGLEWALEW